MMQEEITDIRRATHADMPGVTALTQRLYAIKRSEAFYAWYFLDSAIESELYCAYDNDILVGMLGIHSRRLSNSLNCGHIVGINVAPEYAGKGAFISLAVHVSDLLERFDLLCMFANESAIVPCQYYFRMKFDGLYTFVKELDGAIDFNGAFDAQPILPKTTFTVTEDDDRRIRFQHSEQFRQWRFGRHPLFQYTKVECDSGDFAIVKTFTDVATGVTYGDIVDLEYPRSQTERLNVLLQAACYYLCHAGAHKVTLWATPDSRLRSVALQYDFHEVANKTNWGISVQNGGIGTSASSLSNWELYQSDATNY